MMNSPHQGSTRVVLPAVASLFVAFLLQPGSERVRASEPADVSVERFWLEQYDVSSFGGGRPRSLAEEYSRKLLAKAKPDECFQGIGNPANLSGPLGFLANYPGDLTNAQVSECLATAVDGYETVAGHAQPKANQAYVWGLARHRRDLWFGTVANTHCLVFSSFLQFTEPTLNSSWACEGSRSPLADVRPPRVYVYDLDKGALNDLTAAILSSSPLDAARLRTTFGLRSAGAHQGVVFLGGVSSTGVTMFAFDARTRTFIGSVSFDGQGGRPLYTNIRQWRVIQNELYVGLAGVTDGVVLRWIGNASSPFEFERVGDIAGDPAYLTEHKGRVFVSTWPNLANVGAGAAPMSIWMSPAIGRARHLGADDAGGWQRIWTISDYEPERSVVLTTGGGALMSYKDDLYWGTMHVPGASLLAWQAMNPGASEADARQAVLGTYRPISVFRARAIGTPRQQIELLYGSARLPQYTADDGWNIVDNHMSQAPAYGPAGFGNFFNNYTWWMEVFDDRLFVGTMDFLYLGAAGIRDTFDFPDVVTRTFERLYGADLWAFSSRRGPAAPVSTSGVGNFTNYGIRTMVATPDAIYLGTANPMNLLTDPDDDLPDGGWELIRLRSRHDQRHDRRDDPAD